MRHHNLILTPHLIVDADTLDVWCRFTYFRSFRLWWGQLDERNDYRRLPSRLLKREWREARLRLYKMRAEKEIETGRTRR